MMGFKVEDVSGSSRTGVLRTSHGDVDTPVFLPVATKGTVKTLTSSEIAGIGYQGLITNALHLYLRPGLEIIERAGGLHRFMGWDGCLFSDSGGFQIIRKGFNASVTDDGVRFKNSLDGKEVLLSPELCMEIQEELGTDIAMVLDDCPAYGVGLEDVKKAVDRTILWAARAKEAHGMKDQMMFAIVQGGTSSELRKRCSDSLVEMGFDGYGIGGLSIGEPKEEMMQTLEMSVHLLPEVRPRYLMGVGSPLEIVRCVRLGVDVFDSVFPTRGGRHATVFTREGRYNLGRNKFDNEEGALEEGCDCVACRELSVSFLNHLMREKEMLGMRLISVHNLSFLKRLMDEVRVSIKEGTIEELEKEMGQVYGSPIE